MTSSAHQLHRHLHRALHRPVQRTDPRSGHQLWRRSRPQASTLLQNMLARLWELLASTLARVFQPGWRALKARGLASAMALAGLASVSTLATSPLNNAIAQASALKGAPQVVHGQASFNQVGKERIVTNSNGAIINWQQFNIDRGELTRFVQQNAQSQVLNRVVGVDPSVILGTLQSNGRVFLINPNGIMFGAGAQVDVAGLVASTLNLSNADFLNNRLRFTDTPGAGSVKNEGNIRTALGGEVLLVAPRVENSGLIFAPEGKILLAAGKSVEVADIDKPSIRVEISNTEEHAVNLGTLMAKHISIYGGLVQNSGRIQASSAVVGENGKVILRGKAKVELSPTSVITATGSGGTTGGDIDISAENALGINGGGEVVVQGVLSTKPTLDGKNLYSIYNAEINSNIGLENNYYLAANLVSKSPSTGQLESSNSNFSALNSPAGTALKVNNTAAAPASVPGPTVADAAVAVASTTGTGDAGGAAASPPTPPTAGAGASATPSIQPSPSSRPVPASPERPQPNSSNLPALPASPAPSPAGNGQGTAGYGVGGNIRVSARGRVTVGDDALIDASGPLGGGNIMVGGGWQGLNPNIITSNVTYIAKSATLYANADLKGNGGLVVVWANDTAQVYGKVAARGGAQGGDGGAIETSGKRMLDIADGWIADASAGPGGKAGLWLLDPNNVTISGAATVNASGDPNWVTTGDSAIITVATIQTALNAGINVTITTSAGGAQLGDITISSAISKTAGGDATLTLSAHNNININAGISATGVGKLNLVLNANSDAVGGGAATLASGASLALNTGTISSGNGTALLISGGTLNNVSLAVNATVAASTTSYFSNNLNLVGGVTVTIGNNANWQYIGNTSITGAGTLDLSGTNAQVYRNASNTGLTIGSGVTVQATGATTANVWLGLYSDETITLQSGAIWNVNNSAKTWYTGNVVNQGTVNVSAGGVFFGPYSGNSANAFNNTGGTVNLSGGYLALGYTNGDVVDATQLGTINQTLSGLAYVNGNLNLGGNVIDLSVVGLTNLIVSSNASIVGTAGNSLIASTKPDFVLNMSGGTLNGVNLGVSAKVNDSVTAYFTNGLSIAAGKTVTIGNNANWQYIGNTSITGAGTLDLSGTNAQVYRNASNTGLTIGSGVTVQATGATTANVWLGLYSDETITLQSGAIWNVNNSAKTWYTGNVVNQGTVNVSAGGVFFGPYSGNSANAFNNTGGTVNLSGGYLALGYTNGDVVDATQLGTINQTLSGLAYVNGNLNLGGNVIDLSVVGLTNLIVSSNASIVGTAGNSLIASTKPDFVLNMSGGTLNGVNLGVSAKVNDSVTAYFTNGLSIAAGKTVTIGNNANWQYIGNTSITGAGTLDLSGTNAQVYRNASNTGLTIGSGVTVQATGATTANVWLGLYSDETITLQSGAIWNVNNSAKTWYTGNVVNQGTVNVSAGGVFFGPYSGNSANAFNNTGGTVNLSGGYLALGYTNGDVVDATQLGTINQTLSGLAYVNGNLNLGGNVIDLSVVGLTNLIVSSNASIVGTAGNSLIASTKPDFVLNMSGGTLNGVNLGVSAKVNDSVTAYFTNGLSIAAGKTVTIGNNANWQYIGNTSITGAGTLDLSGTNAQVYRNASNTGLTIGSGVTVQATGATTANVWLGLYSDETITLQSGAIWNVNNSAKTWYTGNVVNQGTVNVSAGGVFFGPYSGNSANAFNNTGGTVNLSGGYLALGYTNGDVVDATQLGTINQTLSGLAYVNGNLNLGGNVIDLSVVGLTNLIVSSNASIVGTAGNSLIASTKPDFVLNMSGGTLNGVNLGVSAKVNDSVTAYFTNGLSIAAGKTVTIGNNANWQYIGNTSITGAGTLALSGTNAQVYRNASNTGLTIGSGVTVQATGATTANVWLGLYSDETITLQSGAIWNVNNSAKTWYTGNVVNQGTVTISAGILNLGAYSGTGIWSSTAPINLTGGTLNLTDNFSAASLATVNKTGGNLNISGSLDNSGNILDVAFLAGGVISGTILGGTVISSNGQTLVASSNPIFDGVTLGNAGNLNLTINGGIQVKNGITLANGAVIDKGNGIWYWVSTGAQNLAVAGGGNATLNSTGGYHYAGWSVTGQTLTFAAGLTQAGNISIYDSSAANVVNLGVINQSTAATTSTIQVTNFTNAAGATLSTSAGTTTLNSTTWSNAGTLDVSGGIMNLSGTNASNTGGFNLSGGTLNLGGTLSTPVLGSFVRTGGLVNITGVLNNAGQTLDVGSAGVFSTGGLNNVSGTILGGTIISGDGTVLTTSSNPIFDGVTLGNAGNLNLTINGGIQVKNGITLANGAVIDKGNGIWYWVSTGAQNLAVAGGGNATLNSTGGYHYAGWSVTGQTLTFAAGLTQAGNISIYDSSAANVVNLGVINQSTAATTSTIQVTNFTNAAGATLSTSAGTTTLNSTTWSNAGTLDVSGGIMNLSGTNASNTGGFNLSGGTLNLGGTLSTPVLGSFVRTGGLVNITGVLNNAGQTLDVGSAGVFSTGGLNNVSGTILGGTIISGDGTVLTTSSNPIFDGVTLGNAGNLNLTINGGIQVKNGITLANGAVIDKGNGIWYWVSTGAQNLAVAGGGNATLNSTGGYHYAGWSVTGQTLTFAAGLTQAGNISIYDSSAANVVNLGVINQSTAATTSTIQVTNFTNAAGATLSTSAGTTTLNSTTWSNAGTLDVSGGIMNLSGTNASNTGGFNLSGGTLNLGGTLSTPVLGSFVRTGGLVNITGVLNNAGQTLDVGSAGVFSTGGLNNVSGTILGGTIISGDGTVLTTSSNPIFDGVTLGNAGNLNLTINGGIQVKNGITLANGAVIDKGNGIWYWVSTGAQNLAVAGGGNATLNSTGGYHYAGWSVTGQTLTFAAGLTQAGNISIYDSSAANVVNLGVINQSTAATTSTIQVTNFTNPGTLAATAGTISSTSGFAANTGTITISAGATFTRGNASLTNNGTILSGGTINMGTGTLTNNGTLRIGASPGFTTIAGNLTMTGTSVLDVEIAGYSRGIATGYDALHVTGNVTLGGTVNVLQFGGFVANLGDIFHIVSAGGTRSGTFATVVPPSGLEPFAAGYQSSNAFLQRGNTFTGVNVWNTDSSGNFNLAANWSAGVVPGAVDTVIIDRGPLANPVVTVNTALSVAKLTTTESMAIATAGSLTVTNEALFGANLSLATGGTLTLNGTSSVAGNFTQTGGTLGGAGTLTLTGAANTWSGTGGSWTGGGSTVLASGAALTFSGTGIGNTFAGRSLTISSGATADITGTGTIELDPGSNSITNNGTFNWASGGGIRHVSNGQGALTLTNNGTINKTGAGAFTLGAPAPGEEFDFNNAGTLNVNAGTLSYVRGTGAMGGSTNIAGGATWNTTGGAAVSFGAGSTFSSAGNLSATGGSTTWAMPSGSFTQTGNISASSGVFAFTPDVNVPQVNISGTGQINFNGAATTPSFTQTGGTLGGTGTLTLTGAANTWSGTGGSWTGGGSTVLASGAALTFSGTGIGNTFAGRNLTISSGATADITGTGTIELDPGSNSITNNGTFNWASGGGIRHVSNGQGALTLTNNGTINKTGAGAFTLGAPAPGEEFDFNNAGTLNVNAGTLSYVRGTGAMGGSTNIAGGATWNTTGGAAVSFGAGSTFSSAGNLSATGGSTTWAMPSGSFTQTGNISASSGVFAFTPDVNVPQVNISGTGQINFNGAATTPSFTQTGGTLGGTGTLTLTGAANTWSGTGGSWTGGGSTVLASGAALTFSGTGIGNTFAGRNLTISSGATADITGTGTIELDPGTNSITNNGTFNWASSGGIRHVSNGQGALTLTNNGTVNKTGAGTFILGAAAPSEEFDFNNQAGGTLFVAAGTLNYVRGTFNQAGTLNNLGNLFKQDGFTNTGLLTGPGSYNMGTGALTNGGVLRPSSGGADQTVTVSITGDYVQTATGTLEIDVEGTIAGAYDVLIVNGTATLDGTLKVNAINGYVTVPAHTFPVLSYSVGRSGSFASVNALAFSTFAPSYAANTMNFALAGGGCIVDVCWIGASGLWSDGFNWSTGIAPVAGQRALADVAGNQTITLSSGNFGLLDFTSSENFVLSGGSLTSSGGFSMNPGTTFALSGGSLVANGTFTAPVVNLSSGSFGGIGTIVVTSDFNQTGGAFNPTGSVDLTRSLGAFNIGALTLSGTARLQTLAGQAVNLNGDIQTTNAGLAANAAAIQVNAAGALNLASTTDISALGSGAVALASGGNMDLKVNDGGNNGSSNAINAVGNVSLASGGLMGRSDGNSVGATGAALTLQAAGDISRFGGALTATSGPASITSTGGAVAITSIAASASSVSANAANTLQVDSLSAANGVNLASGATMTLGPVTNSAGAIVLAASGAGSNLILNGDVINTASGFAANQAALSATAGGDILIASTTDISASSGAVALAAAGNVDLKVNDGGNNGSANSINAAGNLDITASTGQIFKSDGNVAAVTAANLNLTAGSAIGALGGAITATNGNVSLNAPGTVAFTAIAASGATGSITINSTAATVTGGTLTAGQNISLNLAANTGVTLGAITAGTGGNGLVSLINTGTGAVNLNGDIQTTNAGLAANAAAIQVNAAGALNLASTTDISALGSGAVALASGGNMDLKVNDGGNNGSSNAINAVGNVSLASGGLMGRSDGNSVGATGAALTLQAAGDISRFGGALTATSGPASITSTGGAVAITSIAASASSVSANAANTLQVDSLSAANGVNLASGATMTLGPVTNSAGAIVLAASGAGSNLILNGDVINTASGFAANQAALSATAGGDILIASTTDISASSGAVALAAAGNVDLKVNDGGNNGSANSINAAGNLDITASTGQIFKSDGNVAAVTAANLNLTAGSAIGALGGAITATNGNVSLNAPGTVAFTAIAASGATGSITINSTAATVTGGTLTAGQNISLNLAANTGVTLGAITAGTGGNGLVSLINTGTGAVNLNGDIQTTNAGLAANAAAIQVNAAGALNLASTTDISALGSGAVALASGGNMDLKVNDGGNNGSSNAINAVGNVSLASGGLMGRSDGNSVGATGAALTLQAAGDISRFGGALTATSGPASITSTGGAVAITSIAASASSVSANAANTLQVDSLSAANGVNLASGATMTLGPVTNSAGAIVLAASGAGSNLILNGDVINTASGFAANQAALSATAGGDILIASTTDISASSGAVALAAAGNVDLKVNDGGNNGSANSINAAGNLDITASTGQIFKSDGNVASAAAPNIAVSYAVALDPTISLSAANTLSITKSVGDLTALSSAQPNLVLNAPGGNVIFAPGANFSGGPVTVSGGGSALFNSGTVTFATAFDTTMPVNVNGATVNVNGATPQHIGSVWTVNSGALNLPAAGANVLAGAALNVVGGIASLAGAGTLNNAGTVTANGNLTLPGDFINQAGATANLGNLSIGGSLFNSGDFNVNAGTVNVQGTQIQQLGGELTVAGGTTLNMTSPAGLLTWQDGIISGAGLLDFTGGGTYQFAGSGDRVIDGLNFSFNNLTLPNGSLTLQSGSLTLNGATVLPAGVELNLNGGSLTNNGSLDVAGNFSLTGGAFAGPGSLIMSGGSLNLPSGNSVAWTNSGALTNTGTLSLAGSTITNAINNQGTINLGVGLVFTQALNNSGTVVAQSGSATQFSGGFTQQAGGVLALNNGGVNGDVTVGQGTIKGIGTINGDLNVGNAVFAPGASPGAITINGNLNMSAASVLTIELGGLAQGSEYDWVNVVGAANLAGTLNVVPYAGYVAPPGASYTFMKAGTRAGDFASINLAAIPNLTYLPASLSLLASGGLPATPLPVDIPVVNQVIVTTQKLALVEDLIDDIDREAQALKPVPEKEIDVEVCP